MSDYRELVNYITLTLYELTLLVTPFSRQGHPQLCGRGEDGLSTASRAHPFCALPLEVL